MIERQWQSIRRFFKASEAVSALEYALLVGIITVALGVAVTQFGTDLQETIEGIGDDVVTRGNLVTQSGGGSGTPTTP